MKGSRRRRERGFTITSLLIYAGIGVAIVYAGKYYFSYRAREAATATALARMKDIQERLVSAARLDVAWKNSMRAAENSSMACLRDHSSCYEKGGLITLRDELNRLVIDATNQMNGFTMEGRQCAAFLEKGSEGCPIRVDLRWRPQCARDCVDPKSVQVTGTIKFRPGNMPGSPYNGIKLPDLEFGITRAPEPGIPRSCQDVLASGLTETTTYQLSPVAGQPPFPVWCDLSRDGGGWALVAVVGAKGTGHLPESNFLVPTSTGRLPGAKISALLNVSDFQSENNLRLELPGVDGGLVLGASTHGSIDPVAYTAALPPGDCRSVQAPRNVARHAPAPGFRLEFEGDGLVGLTDKTDREGPLGFYTCLGARFLGQDCGKGCGGRWHGTEHRQKGMIWVR